MSETMSGAPMLEVSGLTKRFGGLVANSDLLGIVPDGLVERRADVAKFKLPFDLPGFDAGVVWHERSERDVGISGLRDGIKELVEMAITAGYLRPCD